MVVVILDGMKYTGTIIQEGARFYLTMTEQFLSPNGWTEPEEWQVDNYYFSLESAQRAACERALDTYYQKDV